MVWMSVWLWGGGGILGFEAKVLETSLPVQRGCNAKLGELQKLGTIRGRKVYVS